jgi:hypothetical protein
LLQVIYHLHSQNDEHGRELSALSTAYETEIDQVLEATRARITEHAESLRAQKSVACIRDFL